MVMERIRTFIAVELEDGVRAEAAKAGDGLKTGAAKIKWVEVENLHLTIRFLGEISQKEVEKVKEALEKAAGSAAPFELKLGTIGAFPRVSAPRVIWAGVEKGGEGLAKIYESVQKELTAAGFGSEKRDYSAHLTLGRVKYISDRSRIKRLLESAEFRAQKSMTVQNITLFRSTLTPKGPLYSAMGKYKLGHGS